MSRDDSLILHVAAVIVVPAAIVLSAFLLFAGHNSPGGGFVGGLVAGAALALRYADAGPEAVERSVPGRPEVLLGVGLGITGATGVVGWLTGGQLFESSKISFDAPLLGTLKTTTALPFDIGVFLVVVGLVIAVLTEFGAPGVDPSAVPDPASSDSGVSTT